MSLDTTVVPHPVDDEICDSGSVTVHVTVTGETYHPLLPAVPATCATTTGGVGAATSTGGDPAATWCDTPSTTTVTVPPVTLLTDAPWPPGPSVTSAAVPGGMDTTVPPPSNSTSTSPLSVRTIVLPHEITATVLAKKRWVKPHAEIVARPAPGPTAISTP